MREKAGWRGSAVLNEADQAAPRHDFDFRPASLVIQVFPLPEYLPADSETAKPWLAEVTTRGGNQSQDRGSFFAILASVFVSPLEG